MTVAVTGDAEATARVLDHLPAQDGTGSAVLGIQVHASEPPPAGRHAMTQSPVEISIGHGGEPILHAGTAGAVVSDPVMLHLPARSDPRMVRAVLDVTWPLALPRFGRYHVHGAALRDPHGRGWLLAGDAGSGKSTTALSLALNGWSWTSDDATYIHREGDDVVAEGWVEPPRLSARSAAALRLSREDHASPEKTPVALPTDVLARRARSVVVHRLVLPEIAGFTRIERLDAARALDGLLRASAWLVCLPSLAAEYLRILADVAALPAWRLLLGPELLDEPERAATLLAECEP